MRTPWGHNADPLPPNDPDFVPVAPPQRPRADVLQNLTDARHRAGRMHCADPAYGPLHAHINDLLDELEEIDRG